MGKLRNMKKAARRRRQLDAGDTGEDRLFSAPNQHGADEMIFDRVKISLQRRATEAIAALDRTAIPLRRALSKAPSDRKARAWQTIEDYRVEWRIDRRWNDSLHRWEKRRIHFTDEEQERRHQEGRWTQADASW